MKPTKVFIIAVCIVIFIWILCAFLSVLFIADPGARGQFGDSFGSINALFSGLAFSGLLYTIFLQREELTLQREELKLQREEMKRSNLSFAEQARAQENQFNAAVAELKVQAIIARIEAIKMEASPLSAHMQSLEYAPKIRECARAIELISESLKNG